MTIAAIFGVSGLELTGEEKAFFRDVSPLGFILFARNIEGSSQLKQLTESMRECLDNPDAPILIDQEGGRVQRIRPPLAPSYPAAQLFGELAVQKSISEACDAAFIDGALIARDLNDAGVSVNCAPVLDLYDPRADKVIGTRAFSSDPKIVSLLGRAFAEGTLSEGVLPVIKHLPGHGKAPLDSHLALPRVTASLQELEEQDFVPFKALNDLPLGMVAHILYEAIDPSLPSSLSPIVVQKIIRQKIGFKGLLITDDLGMHALQGSFADRARMAFDAGCDIALHCSGKIEEMKSVSAVSPLFSKDAFGELKKTYQVERKIKDAAAERDKLLSDLSEIKS